MFFFFKLQGRLTVNKFNLKDSFQFIPEMGDPEKHNRFRIHRLAKQLQFLCSVAILAPNHCFKVKTILKKITNKQTNKQTIQSKQIESHFFRFGIKLDQAQSLKFHENLSKLIKIFFRVESEIFFCYF